MTLLPDEETMKKVFLLASFRNQVMVHIVYTLHCIWRVSKPRSSQTMTQTLKRYPKSLQVSFEKRTSTGV